MSNFEKLFEHTIERFNYGGFQIHDYVKIVSTDVEGASQQYLDELHELKNSDLNLKVLDITTGEYGGNRLSPDKFSIVIGQETASGIFPRKITVPPHVLEVIGYNVPPSIPDSWKVKNKSDFDGEPEVLGAGKEEDLAVGGDTKSKDSRIPAQIKNKYKGQTAGKTIPTKKGKKKSK